MITEGQCVLTHATPIWLEHYGEYGCHHFQNQLLSVLYEFSQIKTTNAAVGCPTHMQRWADKLFGAYPMSEGRFQGVLSDKEHMGLQFSFQFQPIRLMDAMQSGNYRMESLMAMLSMVTHFQKNKVYLTHPFHFENWCYRAEDHKTVFYTNFHAVTGD